MPSVFSEPDLTVRFKFKTSSFTNNTYERLRTILDCNKYSRYGIAHDLEILSRPKCNGVINKSLKFHITKSGNYKLHSGTIYRHRHKENDINKSKMSDREYYDWQSRITRDEYINSHLDEFDVDVDHYIGNERTYELHHPIKIEL